MTMRWFEGFEVRKNSTALTQAYSQLTFGSGAFTTGRLHGTCLRNVGGTGTTFTTPGFASPQQVYVAGCAFRRDDAGTTNRILMSLYDGASNRQITVATFGSGGDMKIMVYTDSAGGSHTWTSAAVLQFGTWYYIEFKVTIAPSTGGSFELRINSTTALSQTGVNTANAGTSQADRVRFVCEGSASDASYLDDIYVNDTQGTENNDWKGDQVIEGLLPTAEGNSSQWTPSTGDNNAAMVDDADGPDNDSTYVSTAANGIKDTYAFGDLSFISGSVNAVMLAFNARILTAGSRTLRAVARTGGTDYEGSDQAINNTGYQERQQIWEKNPDTDAAWTASEINAAEFGVLAVA